VVLTLVIMVPPALLSLEPIFIRRMAFLALVALEVALSLNAY